jgi:hypothetical protein
MPNLFVSHSARDRAAVSTFVDTVIKLGCGLSDNTIFYSSGAATGVPIGVDLNTYVQGQVSKADLVLAVITPAFRESHYCIAELGAAWSRAGNLFPIAAPGTRFVDLDGVLHGMLIKELTDAAALDELRDRIEEIFGQSTNARTWGQYRDQWLYELAADRLQEVAQATRLSSSACSRHDGHMELFWTDGSGRVFYRWWEKGSGWSDVRHWDEPNALYVAAISRQDGDELLFGVSSHGPVWMRRWRRNKRGWMVPGDSEWIPGKVVGPLTAVSHGSWHVELSAWTPTGEQCHIWRLESEWTEWTTDWH